MCAGKLARAKSSRVVVLSESSIPWDSHGEAESSHDWGRCSQSCNHSERSLSTCSSRGAGLKPRTCFLVTNSASPCWSSTQHRLEACAVSSSTRAVGLPLRIRYHEKCNGKPTARVED